MFNFVLFIVTLPISIIALFVVIMFLMSLYYYFTAWLTGSYYAKTIPDKVLLKNSSLEILGNKK
jgi:hypothetical protein